jgi:SHS2 domain-containing protein
MGYSFVDHTADVAADLTGRTLGELFQSAAQAFTDTVTEISRVRPLVTQSVTLEAGTLEDLLVDWLNELLYRFEVQDMLFSVATVRVEDEKRDGCSRLTGTVVGELFDPSRHPIRVLVKSATYHALAITRDAETWRARIVFDI